MKYHETFFYYKNTTLNDYFNVPIKRFRKKIFPLIAHGQYGVHKVKYIYVEVM